MACLHITIKSGKNPYQFGRENLLFLVKYVVCSITFEQNLNFILQCAAVEGVVSFGISCDYGEIS